MKSLPPLHPIASLFTALVALAAFLCTNPAQADEASATKKADVDDMLKIGVTVQTQTSDAKPNDPLPRVLLLGDSIAGGYAGPVSSIMKGKAFVRRGNSGGPTTAGLKNLDEILGDEPWDLIHFNWGLHDMTFQTRMALEERGIEQYAARLEQLVVLLKETNAKLIWATTTPWCPEPYEYAAKRLKITLQYSAEDEKRWKDVALGVMEKHDIPVNDLHALLLPNLNDYLIKPDDIHFNKKASETMAGEIAVVISDALQLPPPDDTSE